MLTVSIDYQDKLISNPGSTLRSMQQESWFQDSLAQEWIKTIDKMDVIQGFVLRDRWGQIVPPDYLSNGSKSLLLMKFQDKYPVYATRCGDNCIPFIERIANEKDIHVVLHHCMHFSEGFKFYVTDVNRIVTAFNEWVDVYYEIERSL